MLGSLWETAHKESSDGLQSCQVFNLFSSILLIPCRLCNGYMTCSLWTQVFQVAETKAGNLSVCTGHVIEETQYYWLGATTLNIVQCTWLFDFVNSPYWCWSRALQGCYRIYPHPSCNWYRKTHISYSMSINIFKTLKSYLYLHCIQKKEEEEFKDMLK